jgi:hypothetical protein
VQLPVASGRCHISEEGLVSGVSTARPPLGAPGDGLGSFYARRFDTTDICAMRAVSRQRGTQVSKGIPARVGHAEGAVAPERAVRERPSCDRRAKRRGCCAVSCGPDRAALSAAEDRSIWAGKTDITIPTKAPALRVSVRAHPGSPASRRLSAAVAGCAVRWSGHWPFGAPPHPCGIPRCLPTPLVRPSGPPPAPHGSRAQS